jgi:polysaccharide pyruvyl transferase WcaK-like protein
MRILQVASFKGNIGDIANHFGFRTWFESFFQEKVTWHEYEIRKVFRKEVQFDQTFVDIANQFDLLVIGGGNFFELWVESSPTGTSISIKKEHLDKILVPIFVNAIGVDDGMGVSSESVLKFNSFLEYLVTSPRCLVSIRNDGAYITLQKHVTNRKLLDHILAIPDGGFFARLKSPKLNHSPDSSPVIGVNLAGDMPNTRFQESANCHSYQSFLQEFSIFLRETTILFPDIKFIFFPHIYSDLKIISDLFEVLSDEIRREHCRVEAYDSNITFEDTVFNAYLKCDLILGMRFHANVLAIANKIPVIGLNCYKQIQALYSELGASEYCIDIKQLGFSKSLIEQVGYCLTKPQNVEKEWQSINNKIIESREEASLHIYNWLKKQKYILSKPDA